MKKNAKDYFSQSYLDSQSGEIIKVGGRRRVLDTFSHFFLEQPLCSSFSMVWLYSTKRSKKKSPCPHEVYILFGQQAMNK